MILLEELIEDYKRQAEQYGEGGGYSDGGSSAQMQAHPSTTGEGISARTYEPERDEDGRPKLYFPSAEKGDVMATGEELVAAFGITYEDERN